MIGLSSANLFFVIGGILAAMCLLSLLASCSGNPPDYICPACGHRMWWDSNNFKPWRRYDMPTQILWIKCPKCWYPLEGRKVKCDIIEDQQ